MELFSFLSLWITFISLNVYFILKPTSRDKTEPSGFKSYPLVGRLPDFLRNRPYFLQWTTETLSDCPNQTAIFYHPGKIYGVITANPLNVEHMLKTNFENYPKGPHFNSILEDFLGRGIFNVDGELWRDQRKTASYEFNEVFEKLCDGECYLGDPNTFGSSVGESSCDKQGRMLFHIGVCIGA